MRKLLDMEALCRQFRLPTAPFGNKHYRPGWVNTHCPLCSGSQNYHLGYCLHSGHFFCWRCGWKPVKLALAALLKTSEARAWALAREFIVAKTAGGSEGGTIVGQDISTYIHNLPSTRFPASAGPLGKIHRRYLEQRGFNPDELVNEWSLSSTDGRETDKNWRWRIVVPIYMAHRLVSYVGRTIGHRMDKYRAAPKEWRSLNPHDTLYGLDKVCGNTVVVMEGPADVWRWGPGAVALFGDQSSLSQRILLRRFRRAIIMLDGDDAGKTAGEKLAWQMSGFGMEVQQAILPDGLDPGQLDSGQVQELKKDLGLI